MRLDDLAEIGRPPDLFSRGEIRIGQERRGVQFVVALLHSSINFDIVPSSVTFFLHRRHA